MNEEGGLDLSRFLVWGDLGDGTYANPVLNGDFADADVERFGDTYYLIVSTNHFVPGMTILESRDLVNWRYTGHAIPSLDWQPRYDWRQMDGYGFGTWAGDLVHRDGEWLCYQVDNRYGLTMTRAPHIKGPWSPSITLMEGQRMSDPAVYFDTERHEAWLILNAGWGGGAPDPQRPTAQKLYRLSWGGDRLLDEGRVVFEGNRAEACKLHRFNGRWYILCIEWRMRDRKQLCLRSTTDSIYGPYEQRTVFEREREDDRSACQGSLIEARDGSWWYLHQLVQNGEPRFQGRPQCLQPVEWRDGWPVIGRDKEGKGTGVPVWRHRKPDTGVQDSCGLNGSTDFDALEPSPHWNWNHNPRNERWSLSARPGWLRLIASKPIGDPAPEEWFWKTPNTLSLRHLGLGSGHAETVMDMAGFRPGQFAGLCQFSGNHACLGVSMQADGKRAILLHIDGRDIDLRPCPAGDWVYLRSDWEGDRAAFSFSMDGTTWMGLKGDYTLSFGKWRGNRSGLFCVNRVTDELSGAGFADFDSFRHDYSQGNH